MDTLQVVHSCGCQLGWEPVEIKANKGNDTTTTHNLPRTECNVRIVPSTTSHTLDQSGT